MLNALTLMKWLSSAASDAIRSMRVVMAGMLLTCVAACSDSDKTDSVNVAVAANFIGPARELAQAFEDQYDVDIVISTASTGKLLAQIRQGAPFDVFLAADTAHPAACIDSGDCAADSQRVYAIGQLALVGFDQHQSIGPDALAGNFHHLAIANPRTAPYGVAAMETLNALNKSSLLEGRIIESDGVGQVLHMVSIGAAEFGFVARSQVMSRDQASYWVVPSRLHAPIEQGGVLTSLGAANPHASRFLEYVSSPSGREIVSAHGYALPAP